MNLPTSIHQRGSSPRRKMNKSILKNCKENYYGDAKIKYPTHDMRCQSNSFFYTGDNYNGGLPN